MKLKFFAATILLSISSFAFANWWMDNVVSVTSNFWDGTYTVTCADGTVFDSVNQIELNRGQICNDHGWNY